MLTITDLKFSYGERVLFKDVNLKLLPGNCYGIIGANGTGKTTLLNILSGSLEPDKGEIIIPRNFRLAVLKQDHFAFENNKILDTVIMGWPHLYALMMERESIYAQVDFSEEDGLRISELETEFAELGGWEAEAQAAVLLAGLGVSSEYHEKIMKDVEESIKVRVLLAQALFGNPDILLLDEPTNGLDLDSVTWLEEFLIDFPNIVVVVSHDRHFLNSVCTHICDIDFSLVRLYPGNYDFWFKMSRLLTQQAKDEKRRREDKIKDLKEFIQRFSSNASKSKQATSRKKILDKMEIDDFPNTSRRFPYINFKTLREQGNNILSTWKLSKSLEKNILFENLDLIIHREDKIAFIGHEHLARTAFFRIVSGEDREFSGDFKWGQTISLGYFPQDNTRLFESDISILDWLKKNAQLDDENYIRSFLGRMLFTGEEALKPVNVLSGGEKVRCLISNLMLINPNVLILDEPTNHLDLEAITALNNGLVDFSGVVLFASHDREFVNSIANRIIEFCPSGIIDRMMQLDDYLLDKQVKDLRDEYYHKHVDAKI